MNFTFRSDQSQLQLLITNGGGGIGHPLAAHGATSIKTSTSIITFIERIYLAPLSVNLLRQRRLLSITAYYVEPSPALTYNHLTTTK